MTDASSTAPAPVGWRATFRSLPRILRFSTYVAAGLALLLVITLVAAVVVVRQPFPQVSGEVTLPRLSADVEVIRDENGIPHVYADTLPDLMRAQGYVHAQERFYEMDVRRHATSGRLAEMFGEPGLESDLVVRTLGWRRTAEQELAIVEPETRAALEDYADGVNAFLDEHDPWDIAVQYSLLNASGLGYRPEPWTAVDSLAWLKAMAWDVRGNMTDEVERALSMASVGAERTAELYPPYPFNEHAPIVEGGAVVDGVYEPEATSGGTRNPQRPPFPPSALDALRGVREAVDRMPALLGRGDGIGSNSWVLSGEKSETGAPLLANDPHLGVGLPGIWVQMGLHCRTVNDDCPLDVSGFTFSGVPGVVIGHNADIAWGFTNLGPDVTDLYVERVRGDRWLHGATWRPLRTRTEIVEVRGGEERRLTVRSTAHGPLLSGVAEEFADVAAQAPLDQRPGLRPGEQYDVALQWTALKPGRTADAILAMNVASDWEEFRAAASQFEVPAQNLVYADREGHIGYQAPGRIPIRKSGNDGMLPAEGWRPENDWAGYLPFEGLPHVLDPEEGFVVTANQAVIGPEYPFHLTGDWDRGYRAQRIRTMLGQQERFSPEDLTRMQMDSRHPFAGVLLPHLLDLRLRRGYYRAGQRVLDGWDLHQDADSAGAAYFNAVWRQVLSLTFHDELPVELWPDGGQRWFGVVERLLADPRNGWWDDLSTEAEVEDRDEILRQAMLDARDELTRLRSRNPERWTWGHLHRLELKEPTLGRSGIGAVEWLLNRGGWESGGGPSSVDATAWEAPGGYPITAAPSMRMVVSLEDLDDSRWINLTGVSGHPFHEHYTDQTELWVRGDTLAWPFSRDAVEAAAEDTLTLVPADGES